MTQQDLVVKMLVNAWEVQHKNMNKALDRLNDEQLSKPTANGRNTGVYLLGHLAAVNDGMMSLLGFGEKQYPELENIFLKNPENSGLAKPSIAELKAYWKKINDTLTPRIADMTTDQWLSRHTAVSEEDFAKEPHRNKLNILISRTNHQSYHLGQLAYL